MTLESVVELRLLASVPTQIVSPQASRPVMGLVQDSCLGTYLLTKQPELTMREMMHFLCSVSSFSEKLPSPINATNPLDPRWSSQQLLSQFLPEITFKKEGKYPTTPVPTTPGVCANPENQKEGKLNTSVPKEGEIDIVGGKMRVGVLDNNTIGKKNNSLFHITWNDHGPIVCRDLFNDLAFTASMWLQIQGFSCGISDCVISDESLSTIRDCIRQTKMKASEAIQSAKLGEVKSQEPDQYKKIGDPYSYKKDFSKNILVLMGQCRNNVENQVGQSIHGNNSIETMVKCGSKGNQNNLSQIVGMIGQQEIDGDWIENQLYRRTLPHFYRDDLRPEAHGFVENSFMSGLNPAEYWFHAQEGRVGIITKAIKTAETGYIQRKLIKILEDLRICYDGTVRNASNMIIQTVYGNDGFDACYLESQNMAFLNYNMDQLCNKYRHTDLLHLKSVISEDAWESFNQNQFGKELLEEEFEQIKEYYIHLKKYVPTQYVQPEARSPINFKRLVLMTRERFGLSANVVADIDPAYIITQLKNLRERLVIDPSKKMNYVSTIILNSLMATNLSSKVLIQDYKFNKIAFDHLIENIYITFLKSLIHPGENVGIIAAQSLGEPTTQMALNTFHFTGQGSKANISRGTPRLRELMSLTHNPKTPSMTIHLHDEYFIQDAANIENKQINHDRTEKIGSNIAYITLRDILIRTEIFYDTNDHHTCVMEDQDFIDSYYDLLPITDVEGQKYQWLLRLEFDREAIMRKHITMSLIQIRLMEYLAAVGIKHSVIVSDENAQKLICRIRVSYNEGESESNTDPIYYLHDIESKLLNVRIKGIEGIEKYFVNAIKRDIPLPNGTIVSQYSAEYDEMSKKYNHFRYSIDTQGTNLLDVLCLPHIDTYHTTSNDVWEIYQTYGVEAARKCIITEIEDLLQYNATYIQQRHLSLLVDVMTNQGTLVSVDRHGVSKTDSGPLHRASFEETTTQLTNASIFNEIDQMNGVSGNIMFGQFIPTGTNAFKIALDIEKIKTQEIPKQKYDVHKPKIEVIETVNLDDFCSDDLFDFKFQLNTQLQS